MKSLTLTLRGFASRATTNAFLCTLIIFGLFGTSVLTAQCSLTCGDRQLSVDGNCEAEVTPAHILTDNPLDASCEYRVVITDLNDNFIAESEMFGGLLIHPTLSLSDGLNFKASIEYTDANGDVFSCWSFLTIEDKLAPEVTCLDDVTVACTRSFPDDLMTSSSQCFTAEDTDDVNAAPGVYQFFIELTNEAFPWELITSASLDLEFTGGATSFGIMILGPDGMAYAATYSGSGTSMDAFVGVQTSDEVITGTWRISLNSADVTEVTSAELCFESTSVFSDSGDIEDNCSEGSIDLLFDQLNDVECEGQTDPICAYERVISYRTVDVSGNVSPTCNFTICYNKPSVSSADFVFPPNVELECQLDDTDGDGMPDFNFSSWDTNQNGYPDPSDTGVGYPSIDGIDLIPGEENLCKISVAFSDNRIDLCANGGSFKIIRTWTILDWCESTSRTFVQSIKVSDNQPPFLVCPPDTLTFTANDFGCTTDITFEPLSSTDKTGVQFLFDCSAVTFDVQILRADERDVNDVDQPFNPTVNNGDGTFTAENIPVDTFWVKYIATDGCGNTTECRFESFIRDRGAPFAICDQFTAVALSEDGWARAEAISFDDGSYDACSEEVTLKVRRPSTPCSALDDYEGDDTVFGDFVQFCCADLAFEYVQVELLVTDASGNTNTCSVNVEVQDKFGPELQSCPEQNITIGCSEYDESSLYGDPSMPVVSEATCSGSIVLDYEDSANIDGDCSTGFVTRSWFYTLNGEKVFLNSCQQRITIESNFNTNIIFPSDMDIDCSQVSATAGVPTINGSPVTEFTSCANFAYTSEDQRFYNVDGICFKIRRLHTVIDWCEYVPNSGSLAGYYTHTQIIKVSNTAVPTIQECADEVSQTLDDATCMNSVRLNVPWGYDDCLEQPILPHDMAYNVVSNGQIVEEVASISTTDGTITLQPLPKGTHTANFFIYNSCNNPPAECSIDIVVTETDTIRPLPYCLGGITTVLMNQIGQSLPSVEIWASDFDLGSTDNCTDHDDLIFTFEDGSSFLELGCEDEGIMTLDIFVTDECGNSDFCTTTINIQANGLICDTVVIDSTDFDPNNSRINIAGSIFTETDKMIEGVDVVLNDINSGQSDMIETSNDGTYLFDDVLSEDNYMLQADNDVNYLNGVSTLDILLIQKHILGISQLDSPYKLIAADANNSETISAVDLIQLRKLVLGIINELPNNVSWRFVDSEFIFADPNSPWPFAESISLNNMDSDQMSNDFIAVKIGDVNNNVVLGFASGNTDSRNVRTLNISNEAFKQGDKVAITLRGELNELIGMQFALNYDFHMLDFDGISSDKFTLSENNYHLQNPGLISFSWNDYKTQNLKDALTLEFTAKVDGEISNASLSLVDEVLSAEIYNNDDEISQLKLEVEGQLEAIDQLRLLQNKPNPFSDITNIGFYLPASGSATISIIDLSGKLVYSTNGQFEKGFNELGINSNEINASGLLYYQLDTEYGSETKKMLLIK